MVGLYIYVPSSKNNKRDEIKNKGEGKRDGVPMEEVTRTIHGKTYWSMNIHVKHTHIIECITVTPYLSQNKEWTPCCNTESLNGCNKIHVVYTTKTPRVDGKREVLKGHIGGWGVTLICVILLIGIYQKNTQIFFWYFLKGILYLGPHFKVTVYM